MEDLGYIIGVFCAVGSGIFNNLGTVCQKKVVNELEEGEKVGWNLLKNPLWIFGLLLQMALGTVLFLFAYGLVPEWNVGAALVPGLMAAGLIVLAVGSIRILGEKLNKQEMLGIGLMIIAIVLLGFSELEAEISESGSYTLLEEGGFIIRTVIFTVSLFTLALFCEIIQKTQEKYRGILYSVSSGCMFALANLWVAPLTALIFIVWGGNYVVWFVMASIILVLVNIVGIYKIQQAFQHGQAANLIPIQQVPIQVSPIFVFFIVFMLPPSYPYSLPFMIGGVGLIIVSSFLLAKRQAQLEEIK